MELVTEGKRVRKNTSDQKNRQIDEETFRSILEYHDKSKTEITTRIMDLEKEWDIERVLGVNMSTLALAGMALGIFKDRKWLSVPAVVLGFFMQHSVQGWCPPIEIFRAMKFRSRQEIDQEKHALKALRGDYANVKTAKGAFEAARKG